jgi:hypothetical protein
VERWNVGAAVTPATQTRRFNTSFGLTSGKDIELSELRGDVAVLDIWATSCPNSEAAAIPGQVVSRPIVPGCS